MSRLHTPTTVESSPEASRASLNAVAKSLGSVPNLFRLVGTSPAAGLLKMVPAGRFASSEDIAAGVANLGSADAAYVIGAELTIDGGLGQL